MLNYQTLKLFKEGTLLIQTGNALKWLKTVSYT